MKIVEIIPQLHIGGAEHFVVDLCNELSSEGHDVTLIVINSLRKHGHFEKYLIPNVKLICLEKRDGPDPKLLFKLPLLIRKLKPDIVHTHLLSIFYNMLSPLIYRKAKYFHTIHNAADKEAKVGGRISEWVRKWQFNHGYSIPITISEESDKSFVQFYGTKCKSVLIPNGVSYIIPNPTKAIELTDRLYDKSIKLVNVARLASQKNQIELVKAIEILNNEGFSVQLFIVGNDNTPEGNAIRNMACSHSKLIGPKSNPRDYISAADAFVLSSVYEGMPLTLIESFSVGTIPICTPVGGIKNMIQDGVNGILSKGTDAIEIANAIRTFALMSPSKRTDMQNQCKNSFLPYGMQKCAKSYIELFKNAISTVIK